MLFKKSISSEDYCTRNQTPLFSLEREAANEALRRACNDTQLNAFKMPL
jgi:hypothetical protein